jgi:Fe-S cluster assembly protein SufD
MSEFERSRDHFLSLWDGFRPATAGREDARWADVRRQARDLFAEHGLPTTRLEEWRYTNLEPLAALRPRPAAGARAVSRGQVEAVAFPVFACSLVVFVNGNHRADLSTILSGGNAARVEPGPWAAPLADPKEHPFLALNRAFLDDGGCVRIPAGPSAGPPLHLVFASGGTETAGFSQPRLRIDAEAGSQAVIVQDHVSLTPGSAHFTNASTEVALGAGASLDLVVVQREGEETIHVSNLAVHQSRDSRLRCHVLTLGGRLVRNDLSALLAEEGVECTLRGLFLGTGDRLADNHTLVDHAAPHGTSEELYKGILAGRSRGVFRGRVLVRPHAQKTNARQSNPNLLLGDGAEIDTKPQLEIWADDVKCSHGSAIGRTDPDALFYLQARGIAPQEARRMLTRGFAAEVLGSIPGDALREGLGAVLDERLAGLEGRS